MSATVVAVPGDGLCLFHALAVPLGVHGAALKDGILKYIEMHPTEEFNGATWSQWIEWEHKISHSTYVLRMKQGHWGGAFEMTVLSHMLGIPIFVYEKRNEKAIRIADTRPKKYSTLETLPKCICILYENKNHYSALQLSSTPDQQS